jgi:hypothetical protein
VGHAFDECTVELRDLLWQWLTSVFAAHDRAPRTSAPPSGSSE